MVVFPNHFRPQRNRTRVYFSYFLLYAEIAISSELLFIFLFLKQPPLDQGNSFNFFKNQLFG